VPREHSRAEISSDGAKDPFLYNPRSKAVEAGKVSLELDMRDSYSYPDGDCCE
jgi:hypothetical protein